MSDSGGHGSKKDSLAALQGGHAAHQEEGEGSWLVSYADMMTLLVGFFVILLSFSTVDESKMEAVKQAAAKQFGGVYQVPFGDLSDRVKGALDKASLGAQYDIKQTPFGIEVSFVGTAFFDSGSAEIKPDGQQLLSQLITAVKAEAKDFSILIEGHTDDVPIISHSLFRNNWELSSVRACRVLSYFEEQGFQKSKLTAVGYAEARPIVPNRDQAGNALPTNQSQNRRVVIKVIRPGESLLKTEDQSATDPSH